MVYSALVFVGEIPLSFCCNLFDDISYHKRPPLTKIGQLSGIELVGHNGSLPPKPPRPEGLSENDDEEVKKRKLKIKVKLRDGKERDIQHIVATSFWSTDGKPILAEEFMKNLFGELPKFFKDEEELRKLWSNPKTRKELLQKLGEAGLSRVRLVDIAKTG